jgi:hypothetical protein
MGLFEPESYKQNPVLEKWQPTSSLFEVEHLAGCHF